MNNFNINVKDAATGQPVLADIYLLATAAGSPIMVNNAPVAFQTDVNGNYTFTNANTQVFARIQSTGYASKNVTLVPGANNIAIDAPGATFTVTGARTAYNKYKTIIWLALIMLVVVLGVKFKVIPL